MAMGKPGNGVIVWPLVVGSPVPTALTPWVFGRAIDEGRMLPVLPASVSNGHGNGNGHAHGNGSTAVAFLPPTHER